jgi:hypothetical protein
MSHRHPRTLAGLALAALVLSACAARPTPPATGRAATPPAPAAASPPPAAGAAGWTELATARVVWIARNRAPLAPSGQDPALLAYCRAGAVRVSRDGGATWAALATAGVPGALAAAGYVLPTPQGTVPACDGAVADPNRGGAAAAGFSVGTLRDGMPPIDHAAVVTVDGGAHWAVLAPPPGFAAGAFGGFSVVGGTVFAIFGRGAGQAPAWLASSDGGRTWRSQAPPCPAQGPCLRWGPAPSGTGSCAMHAYPQPVAASTDGGRSWALRGADAAVPQAMLANGCLLAELVGLGDGRGLLVADGPPGEVPPLRLTSDGGRTWVDLALPPAPASGGRRGLQMLPDGALLAAGGPGRAGLPLVLLPAGAAAWCTVPGLALGGTTTDPATMQVIGDRLWWLEDGAPDGPVARSVPLRDLHC